MKVKVSFTGRFRDIFQAEDIEVELDEGSKIRDLLNLICDTDERSSNVFDKSMTRLKPSVTVTINGRFIIHLNWLDTALEEGDKVTIFVLHSGG